MLYEIGFNHFWHAPSDEHGGDLDLHPGPLLAGHLRARLPRGAPDRGADQGLPPGGLQAAASPSYPHPWLMPEFWQFPTVSMGLGPIMAIYQAGFMKYLNGPRDRRHEPAARCGRSWATARWTSPSRWARSRLAGREHLDNLIFVVNCNLQRLDGPVRGNGKIIQELEAELPRRGLERDQGDLGRPLGPAARPTTRTAASSAHGRGGRRRVPDVQVARRRVRARALLRRSTPSSRERVEDWSDDEIWDLNRGGHDPRRSTPPTPPPQKHEGQPTVILAKTIKGYGMGEAGEGQNITHQQKKMTEDGAARLPRPLRARPLRRRGQARPPSTGRPTTPRR